MSIHINKPKAKYVAQVRKHGKRLWEFVGESYDNKEDALVAISKVIFEKDYKRGRVLACYEWYEPHVVVRVSR